MLSKKVIIHLIVRLIKKYCFVNNKLSDVVDRKAFKNQNIIQINKV